MKKNIQSLLDSDIPTRELSRVTGVNVASISLLRSGTKKIANIRYEVAEKMNDYVTKNTISKADKFMVDEFLKLTDALINALEILITEEYDRYDLINSIQILTEYNILFKQLRYIDINNKGFLNIDKLYREEANVEYLFDEVKYIICSEEIKKNDSALKLKLLTIRKIGRLLRDDVNRYEVREY